MVDVYVAKLYQAWLKYKGVRILVDYDDTLKPYNTASIELCEDVINTLKEAQEYGASVVLWTCRSGERLQNAIDYCKSVGLEFADVNPTEPFLPGYSQKAYGNIVLDDKAGLEQALTTLKLALNKYKKFLYETNKE